MSEPKRKRLVIDLDGTLCMNTETNYDNPLPRKEIIQKLNKLWGDGWDVTIFTARGMNSLRGELAAIEKLYRAKTETWLNENRVCYDRLVFGKPPADCYVDDKGMGANEFSTRDIV